MRQRILAHIAEAMLYPLAAFMLFCAVTLYIPNAMWDEIIARYCAAEAIDPLPLRIFLSVAAALALWILFELMLVMRTVARDPFVERNVRAFVRMGAAAVIAGVLFCARCALRFTPMTAVCAVVMLLAGLFALVLAGVFARAVAYKRENDLTI